MPEKQAGNVGDDEPLEQARMRMVRTQLEARDICDARVLAAMASVPRHRFVPQDVRNLAYADSPLPIGYDQTISQPYIVALMAQAAGLSRTDRVLEIGTGSGYGAAVLACLAGRVYSIERCPELAQAASTRLADLGYDRVEVLTGDGSQGLPAQAPFDAIVVTAAAPAIPAPLLMQLADAGRLVLPVGSACGQALQRLTRRGADWRTDDLAAVCFVPLLGRYGWSER